VVKHKSGCGITCFLIADEKGHTEKKGRSNRLLVADEALHKSNIKPRKCQKTVMMSKGKEASSQNMTVKEKLNGFSPRDMDGIMSQKI
jgi:hypothetical protein